MRFSLIIPVYNICDKIAKNLESISNQTFKDFEALIIIDGSTDSSEAVCMKYAEKDNRVRIFKKENGGLVSARKYGAMIAKGEYIINIDGDDFVEPNYLFEVDKIIRNNNPDMIALGYNEISHNIRRYYNKLPAGMYIGLELDYIIESFIYDKRYRGYQGGSIIATIWTKVVKADIYKKFQNLIPNNITVGEDLLLNSYLIGHIRSLYVSDECYYNYVIHESSMMHKYNIENVKHYLEVASELKTIEYIKENDINVYLFDSAISELLKAVKFSYNYSCFKNIVSSNKNFSTLLYYAKLAKIKKNSLETLIKTLLIHSNNYRIIYLILKLL